jgi:hypothetical protein
MVRRLETEFPAPSNLLTDSSVANALLGGAWYLQYTSPSNVGGADAFPNAWKPQLVDKGSKIETMQSKQIKAQGSISVAGVKVDASDRLVKQTLEIHNNLVMNDIGLSWGRIQVGGKFRPSPNVVNRAIIAFDTALLEFDNGPKFDLSFLFRAIALFRGMEESGWLETTYIDDSIRIGRGNKGTMFLLTRDFSAVTP